MTTMELNAMKQLLIEEIQGITNPELIAYLRKSLDKFVDMSTLHMKRPCVHTHEEQMEILRQSLKDIDEGRYLSTEELEEQMKTW
ncbi:hypothetical protein [uncultured Parabacteroides sp.]|jgi:hypothetical protein|uniref:hypothetical protein n=1 Tax=uncultured Parabacteroides sp. TaxID=512312 RepID=UPI0025F70DFF|nr:hypothetical protein [uncultured Parabacteroides sp.]